MELVQLEFPVIDSSPPSAGGPETIEYSRAVTHGRWPK